MAPEIELRLLRYFLAVADESSFTRAAARIGIAQPPLSQQIHKLEGLVGCRLFDRGARGATLTEAGATLVVDARRILADVTRTTADLRRLANGERGRVVIGFWPSTMFSPLPAAVRRFRARFPDVHVQLGEIAPNAHAEALRSGTIDVAVVRDPDPEPGIACTAVLVEPFVAVVPADHALAKRTSIRIASLRDEPFVLFPRTVAPGTYRKVRELCQAGRFEPRVVQEVEAWHTVVSLVEAGIGVSLVPHSFEHRRPGSLAYVPIVERRVQIATTACTRATGRSFATNQFIEELTATVSTPVRARPGRR